MRVKIDDILKQKYDEVVIPSNMFNTYSIIKRKEYLNKILQVTACILLVIALSLTCIVIKLDVYQDILLTEYYINIK